MDQRQDVAQPNKAILPIGPLVWCLELLGACRAGVAGIGLDDRYANCDGVFVLVCSGSLEAHSMKKLFEIVCNLLIEPIQVSSFVVLELGVKPIRLMVEPVHITGR